MDSTYTTYLSHLDLAVELNNASCTMIETAMIEARAQQQADRAHLLDGAAMTLRDAVDAMSRPPVAVHVQVLRAAAANANDEVFERYVAYRSDVWARAQERLNEAAKLRSTSTRQQRATAESAANPLVYSEPLRLDPLEDNSVDIDESHDDDDAQQRQPSLEDLSAAVLFNLSLAHHLAGEAGNFTAHIDRAIQFYKMTEKMVLKATSSATSGSDSHEHEPADYLTTIVRAVLNNTGQICMQWLGRPELGRDYFARSAALAIAPAPAAADEEATTQRQEMPPQAAEPQQRQASSMDVFALNAMVTGNMNAAGAA